MRTYCLISFWLTIAACLFNVGALIVCEWPREQKPKTIGHQLAHILIELAFIFWLGIILFLR